MPTLYLCFILFVILKGILSVCQGLLLQQPAIIAHAQSSNITALDYYASPSLSILFHPPPPQMNLAKKEEGRGYQNDHYMTILTNLR